MAPKQRKKTDKSRGKGTPTTQPASDSKKKDDKANSSDDINNKDEEEDNQTLSQVFFSHPLVVVAPWILGPYALYLLYYYLLLERPDLLLPLGIHLRPALGIEDVRQVLVIGSMSSGTVQVANDLSQALGLEIGHESSNSQSEFVRDGTVSWMHVVRFLEPPEGKHALVAYSNLCGSLTPQMGFHPAMYRSTGGCSQRAGWDHCWKRECIDILQQEWGCGLSLLSTCQTPFQKTLFQKRHPLRTTESLVVKFCHGNQLETGIPDAGFLKFATALFGPNHDFQQDSCVEAAARFVLEYNRAMLMAKVDGSFQVEETSVCEIAELAGFLDQPVYSVSGERAHKICSHEGNRSHKARKPMVSTKHKRNEGVIQLEWEDLRGGKHGSRLPPEDTSLMQDLKDLTQELGYAITTTEEQ